MKPTPAPQTSERTAFCRAVALSSRFFGAITGRTMNFTPSSSVIITEKLPMVAFGTMLAIQLPTAVKHRTAAIMTRPLRTSRFPFFP